MIFLFLFQIECVVNENDNSNILTNKRTAELLEFVDCTKKMSSDLKDVNQSNCTERIHDLYQNLIDRLKDAEWCAKSLGINQMVTIFL